MPVEGLETSAPAAENTAAAAQTPTSDAAVKNTGAGDQSAAGTQTPPNTPEAKTDKDKLFTQEQVNEMIAKRLPSAVKAELKKLGGEDGKNTPTLDDLQRQLGEERAARQTLEARQNVREYLMDGRNQLNIRSENVAAIEEMVQSRLELGDDGKPTNVKEAVAAVKALAPVLFVSTPNHVAAGEGRITAPKGTNMNDFIREQHAARNN